MPERCRNAERDGELNEAASETVQRQVTLLPLRHFDGRLTEQWRAHRGAARQRRALPLRARRARRCLQQRTRPIATHKSHLRDCVAHGFLSLGLCPHSCVELRRGSLLPLLQDCYRVKN